MMFLLYFSAIIKNMLEKTSKKIYFDAHFHYSLAELAKKDLYIPCGCSCSHSKEEWENSLKLQEQHKQLFNEDFSGLQLAFGIHPQCLAMKNIEFDSLAQMLESLARAGKLAAIGECGFDFFTQEFKEVAEQQEKWFLWQVELAVELQLPVIIHCRKANQKLFEYSKLLKKVPAVLFHSFMGTPIEAKSLIERGINGYFSFGKQLLNNNKNVIACARELPLKNLLCETDAPFQTLKGEEKTYLSEIETVYKAMYDLRKGEVSFVSFANQLCLNYKDLFGLK